MSISIPEYKNHLERGRVYRDLPIKIAVDGGGYAGAWCIALSENKKPPPIIYTVEPISHELLRKNTAPYSNITVVPYGFSNGDKEETFWQFKGSSSMVRGVYAWINKKPEEIAKRVQCYTWDTLIDMLKIEQVDLLKLDIEGAEKLFFEGITKAWPDYIEIEYHIGDHSHEKCFHNMPNPFKNGYELIPKVFNSKTYLYRRKV